LHLARPVCGHRPPGHPWCIPAIRLLKEEPGDELQISAAVIRSGP